MDGSRVGLDVSLMTGIRLVVGCGVGRFVLVEAGSDDSPSAVGLEDSVVVSIEGGHVGSSEG